MANDFYVYGYSDPHSDDPYFYIGKGRARRAYEHLCPSFYCKDLPFYRKIKSMLDKNVQPEVTIIENNLSEQEAHELEIELIKDYGKRNNNTGCLLNLTDGGDGIVGLKKSEIEVAKMRLRQLGKRPLCSRQGSIASEETRRKMSESSKNDKEGQRKRQKGRLKACEKPFAKLNFSGRILQVFRNIVEVEKYGFSSKAVCNALKGRYKTHKLYEWRYLTPEEIELLLKD